MKLQFRLNGKNVETIVPGEKRLLDFIRESNRGGHFFFVPTQEEAIRALLHCI